MQATLQACIRACAAALRAAQVRPEFDAQRTERIRQHMLRLDRAAGGRDAFASPLDAAEETLRALRAR